MHYVFECMKQEDHDNTAISITISQPNGVKVFTNGSLKIDYYIYAAFSMEKILVNIGTVNTIDDLNSIIEQVNIILYNLYKAPKNQQPYTISKNIKLHNNDTDVYDLKIDSGNLYLYKIDTTNKTAPIVIKLHIGAKEMHEFIFSVASGLISLYDEVKKICRAQTITGEYNG